MKNLKDALEKRTGEELEKSKYIKRTGTKGNYRYKYKEPGERPIGQNLKPSNIRKPIKPTSESKPDPMKKIRNKSNKTSSNIGEKGNNNFKVDDKPEIKELTSEKKKSAIEKKSEKVVRPEVDYMMYPREKSNVEFDIKFTNLSLAMADFARPDLDNETTRQINVKKRIESRFDSDFRNYIQESGDVNWTYDYINDLLNYYKTKIKK